MAQDNGRRKILILYLGVMAAMAPLSTDMYLPALLSGRVPDAVMLKYALLTSFVGSVLLFLAFWQEASLFIIYPVLLFTIIPLSAIGAASFSLALSRQGRKAGSASALIGFFHMVLGGLMMPVVGLAGDSTAMPMATLMCVGYGLSVWVFYHFIWPFDKH